VPDFWLNAMKNQEILAEEVNPCGFFPAHFSSENFNTEANLLQCLVLCIFV
jgi:hypothetical protein